LHFTPPPPTSDTGNFRATSTVGGIFGWPTFAIARGRVSVPSCEFYLLLRLPWSPCYFWLVCSNRSPGLEDEGFPFARRAKEDSHVYVPGTRGETMVLLIFSLFSHLIWLSSIWFTYWFLF
jgi:hypothetical protein